MKVRVGTGVGRCEACEHHNLNLYVVTFEIADKTVLICKSCLGWTRDVLDYVEVKEAEA